MPLETEYRSDCHDLVQDFYLPCLQRSTQYRRTVGYFTSRGLSVAAQGITALIHGGGRMLLVASPLFDADDLEAIYHHKWLFVDDDYKGFNVEESKRRLAAWLVLPDVNKSRIGRRNSWQTHVVSRLDGCIF